MSITIRKKSYLYAISLFLLCRFCSFSYMPNSFDFVYTNLSKIFSSLILFYYCLKFKRSRPYFWIVLAYFFLLSISTYLNHTGNIRRVVMEMYPNLAMIALIDIGFDEHPVAMISGFHILLDFLCLLNFLLFIINPNMFGKSTYFLANENHLLYAILISLFIAYSSMRINGGFIRELLFWLYFALLSLNIVMVFSGSNVVGYAAFCLLLFITRKKPDLFGKIRWLAAYGVLWTLIIVFRIQDLFEWLIVGILHKNLSLTNRIYIWDGILSQVLQKPIWGHGRSETVNIFFLRLQHANLSSHNQVLQTLYEGGFVGLAVFVLALCYVSTFAVKYKKSAFYPFLFSALVGILISYLAEAPAWSSVFFLAAFAGNSDKLADLLDGSDNMLVKCF